MDTDTPDFFPSTDPSAPSRPRRERHAGHVIAIVVGCFMLLPGFGFLIGGGAAASAQAFATDDGYFHFTPDRIHSDGVAIAATDMFFDEGADDDAPEWLLDTLDVDLRLRVSGAASTDDVFVGIARTQDVERYLASASYSEIVDVDGHVPRYDDFAGAMTIDKPGVQDFWVVSAVGDGEQIVEWDARGGRWSAVVMNADGSPAVGADIEVGLHSGAVMPIAVVLMVVGFLVLTGAVVLIVIGVRGRRVPGSGLLESPVSFPPPTPADASQIDDNEHTPVG